jgi:hypothetical protein
MESSSAPCRRPGEALAPLPARLRDHVLAQSIPFAVMLDSYRSAVSVLHLNISTIPSFLPTAKNPPRRRSRRAGCPARRHQDLSFPAPTRKGIVLRQLALTLVALFTPTRSTAPALALLTRSISLPERLRTPTHSMAPTEGAQQRAQCPSESQIMTQTLRRVSGGGGGGFNC